MLKVKRPVQLPNTKDNIEELQNEIKNSIKSLYIKNQKDTKVIYQYSDAKSKMNMHFFINKIKSLKRRFKK